MSMPETSNDGEIDKLLAELEKEPEEAQINDTVKKIKAEDVKKVVEWDDHIDTVTDYEDGSDDEIKKEDEFE